MLWFKPNFLFFNSITFYNLIIYDSLTTYNTLILRTIIAHNHIKHILENTKPHWIYLNKLKKYLDVWSSFT